MINHYEKIGLPIFSPMEIIRRRIVDLESSGSPPDNVRTSCEGLGDVATKQRYDLMLQSSQSREKTLPRFDDEDERQRFTEIAKLSKASLTEIEPSVFRLVPEGTERRREHKNVNLPSHTIELGKLKVHFTLHSFATVGDGHHESGVILNPGTNHQKQVACSQQMLANLSHGDSGYVLGVQIHGEGFNSLTSLIEAFHITELNETYMLNQATSTLFEGDKADIGNRLGVREKRSRIDECYSLYCGELKGFALQCCPEIGRFLSVPNFERKSMGIVDQLAKMFSGLD